MWYSEFPTPSQGCPDESLWQPERAKACRGESQGAGAAPEPSRTADVGFKRTWIRPDAKLMMVECLICGFSFACQAQDVAELVTSIHRLKHVSGVRVA